MQFSDPGSLSPLLISFSGIDGAGKTTQIHKLVDWLHDSGLQVCVIRFWEEIAVLRRLRETLGHTMFKGEKGVGTPERPVQRMDKNVSRWYMLPIRLCFCLLDSIGVARVKAQLRRRSDVDLIIFDRYLYDQFANLNVHNRIIRILVRLLLKVVSRPDVAYLLDADATQARARKPEYPLDFVVANRVNYLVIAAIARLTIVPTGTQEEVSRAVRQTLSGRIGSAWEPITNRSS